MRKIEFIAVHCTATDKNTTVESILNYWKNTLGWKNPGYHFIVDQYGKTTNLLPIIEVSNGVQGYNSKTINIAYIGGIVNGMPKDTRTEAQKKALKEYLYGLKKHFPNAIIQGHRDFPDVHKACPCFNAKDEYDNLIS